MDLMLPWRELYFSHTFIHLLGSKLTDKIPYQDTIYFIILDNFFSFSRHNFFFLSLFYQVGVSRRRLASVGVSQRQLASNSKSLSLL